VDDYSKLGSNLIKIMAKKGIKSKDLAGQIGITPTHISYIINGKRQASESLLEKIAAILEVSTDRLTGDAVSSIIDERLEQLGATLEELAENTGVSLHWLKNIDSFVPGELANGEVEYNWITRVAEALGLPGSQLRAALARQEKPIHNNPLFLAEDGLEYLTKKELFSNPKIKVILPDSDFLRRIPLVGKIAAGDPILAIETPGEYIIIDTRINKINGNDINEYFALEVTGQSMEPTIHDGEIVLVKRQPIIEPGEIGVFRCDRDEATIKRFTKEAGKFYLIPDNKQFPVKEFTKDCVCIGKVLESIRRYLK